MSKAMRANRLLVLGIGSRLMRDDGIGPKLIDALQNEACPDTWLLRAAETDVRYAMDLRRAGDAIVLLDAVQTGTAPGTVHLVELETKGWLKGAIASLHDPGAWRMVFEEPHAGGWLIGVEASDIGPGIGLSDALNDAFGGIFERVKEQIGKIARVNFL